MAKGGVGKLVIGWTDESLRCGLADSSLKEGLAGAVTRRSAYTQPP